MPDASDDEAAAPLDCWDVADRTPSGPVLSARPDGRLELGVPDDDQRWLATDEPVDLERWI